MWTSLVGAVSNRTFFVNLCTLEGRAIQNLSFLNIKDWDRDQEVAPTRRDLIPFLIDKLS
jgi:hypothetical protein